MNFLIGVQKKVLTTCLFSEADIKDYLRHLQLLIRQEPLPNKIFKKLSCGLMWDTTNATAQDPPMQQYQH